MAIGTKRPSGGGTADAGGTKKPRFEKNAGSTKFKPKGASNEKINKPGGGRPGGPIFKFSKKPFNKFAGKSKAATEVSAAPVKQDWGKFKKDKKELKLKRKQGKDLFELTVEGKKLYEQLKWYVISLRIIYLYIYLTFALRINNFPVYVVQQKYQRQRCVGQGFACFAAWRRKLSEIGGGPRYRPHCSVSAKILHG